MNSLAQFLVDSILKEETLGTVALFGGGFKPPTKGHLEVVLQGLKDNPEVQQVYILVGSGERNGVTQEEAVKIWKMYQKFIPVSSQIIPVQSPFSYIKTYLQDHQDENVYIFIGARDNNDEDEKDVAERSAFAKKYSEKAIPVKVSTSGGVSGTRARQAALSGNKEEFITYFPEQLTDTEKQEIIDMVSSVVKEDIAFERKRELVKKIISMARKAGDVSSLDRLADIIASQITINTPQKPRAGSFKVIGGKPFTENASYSKDIDIIEKCAQLTNYMKELGMPIEPLPSVEFVNGDTENARDFFGKTAYYDPNEKKIVLYTEGRHPKDIVRSFAHEMIHHMQNLEDRLGNITTTNTQEDDHINDLEKEANLKGTMTFRNWTDSLQEKKVKDPFGLNQFARELVKELVTDTEVICDGCGWEWDILDGGDDLYICHKCGHDNTPNKLNEGVYDSIVSKLSKDVINAWKSQHDAKPTYPFAVLDINYEMEDAKGRPMEFDLLAKIDFKKTKDRQYKVDGGANEGDDESEGFVALNFSVDPRELPQMWSTIAMDIRDVLRHELEHLTQGGWNVRDNKEMEDDQMIRDLIQKYKVMAPKNYFLLDKEVDAMLQGMYFKAKKSRTPFGDVIDDYLDKVGLEPEEKEEIKTRWRGRVKALSLPLFEDTMPDSAADLFTIYLDMDGVIVDFDKQFKELTGMGPREFESNFGKDKFWEKIDKAGVGFWRGMPWMPGGQELYNRVSKHNHFLLSAPSQDESSKIGKRIWRRDNTPSTRLILSAAKNKPNYADKSNILIDDRADTIDAWKAKGGIGILYKSAGQVMKELDKLGL